MVQPTVEDIKTSSDAAEELLVSEIRFWSLAFGRTRLANALGISNSRLYRLTSSKNPPRPTFDLIYRIHSAFGLSWPYIFTLHLVAGEVFNLVDRALKERAAPVDEKQVLLAEDRARARIKELVYRVGLTKCAKDCGFAPASLHSYLGRTSLTMSLIWRIHLLTGVSYSVLASGKPGKDEQTLLDTVGNPDDSRGRFHDLYEPVVRLAYRHVYEKMTEAAERQIPYLKRLLGKKLSLPQYLRLIRVLSVYEYKKENSRAAAELVRKGWQKLKKGKASSNIGLLLNHLAVADKLQFTTISRQIAEHIEGITRDNAILARLYNSQADAALIQMEIFKAERLARKAAYFAQRVTGWQRHNQMAWSDHVLAMASWAFGNCKETLWRIRELLASPSTFFQSRYYLTELELNVQIWFKDVSGARRALKQLREFSSSVFGSKAFLIKLDIYTLRFLLLKRSTPDGLSTSEERRLEKLLLKLSSVNEEILESDSRCVLAVSRYLAKGERGPLKALANRYITSKLSQYDTPLLALPDLFETLRMAGLWSRTFEAWEKQAVEKGLLYSYMTHTP